METVRKEEPANEIRATGTVVGHRHRRRRLGMDNRTDILVHPIVRFETEDGETVEFESELGSNIPLKVGEEVEVFYDPSRPDIGARITVGSALRLQKWRFMVAAVIFAVPAAFFLFVGAIYLL